MAAFRSTPPGESQGRHAQEAPLRSETQASVMPQKRDWTRLGPGALRLILAGCVFVSHVSHLALGRPAVMLFFMLSGYWVTRMQGGDHKQPYWLFVASRILRIWPLLAITSLIVMIAFKYVHITVVEGINSTLLLLGLASRKGDIIGTAWSLDIEMQFYILIPFIIYFRKWIIENKYKASLILLTSFMLGLIIFYYLNILTVMYYIPVFVAGIVIYLFNYKIHSKTAFLFLFMGLVIILILILFLFRNNISATSQDLLFMGPCLLIAPFIGWVVRVPSGRLDRLLGDLSYPFYLVHYPTLRVASAVLGVGLVAKFTALIASAATTIALHLGIDIPIEALRRRLRTPQGHITS